MIPDIVENYDSVNFINSRKGYTLSFTKTYGDVVYQVTETIGGKEDNPRGTRQKTIFLTEITKNASGGRCTRLRSLRISLARKV